MNITKMCSAIWSVFNLTMVIAMTLLKINKYWALGAWVGPEFIVKAMYANYWAAAKALLALGT
jgi:hypothetical protein